MNTKSYLELVGLHTFRERYSYLKLCGVVGQETYGFDRFVNQSFYSSAEWKAVRDFVIVRDNGCDLGIEDRPIQGRLVIHHMNPILLADIESRSDFLLNPEFLITTSHTTHNAIHYGNEKLLIQMPIERCGNDTCPWRRS